MHSNVAEVFPHGAHPTPLPSPGAAEVAGRRLTGRCPGVDAQLLLLHWFTSGRLGIRTQAPSKAPLLLALCPAFVWTAAISALPHKEERFLYVVYPLVRPSPPQYSCKHLGSSHGMAAGVKGMVPALCVVTMYHRFEPPKKGKLQFAWKFIRIRHEHRAESPTHCCTTIHCFRDF